MTNRYITIISRAMDEMAEIGRVVTRIHKAWECIQKTSDESYMDSVALKQTQLIYNSDGTIGAV